MKERNGQLRYLSIVIGAFLSVGVIVGLTNNLYSLYVIPITTGLGISRGLYSMGITVRYIASAFCNLFMGRLYQRFGYRRPTVLLVLLVAASVYNYVPMLLQQLQMSLDQETLDGYILSSYSYYALSSGELTGALSVITDVVNGDDPFRRLQWMHELKQLKVEDIMAFAPMYQALLDNGCMSTAGSQSALNTMPAGTYENIIKP